MFNPGVALPARHPASISTPLVAEEYANDGKRHLLLCASGSVATIKLPNIIQALSHHRNLSIRIILTKSAEKFLNGHSQEQPPANTLNLFPNVDGVYYDDDEWNRPWTRGGGVLHIELRRWQDLMVIAPLSANSMAKIVGGFADNLLTTVVRAWDTTGMMQQDQIPKRIVVVPAMNTGMWRHPITKKHIKVLEDEWGVDGHGNGWIEVLRPTEKELACGDVGDGAMQEWGEIVKLIELRLGLNEDYGCGD